MRRTPGSQLVLHYAGTARGTGRAGATNETTGVTAPAIPAASLPLPRVQRPPQPLPPCCEAGGPSLALPERMVRAQALAQRQGPVWRLGRRRRSPASLSCPLRASIAHGLGSAGTVRSPSSRSRVPTSPLPGRHSTVSWTGSGTWPYRANDPCPLLRRAHQGDEVASIRHLAE